MGNQTQPAGLPSGCTSVHPSPRLHGNQGHMDGARPSSAGTNSAAHIHSVSEKQGKSCTHFHSSEKQRRFGPSYLQDASVCSRLETPCRKRNRFTAWQLQDAFEALRFTAMLDVYMLLSSILCIAAKVYIVFK